jgi:hypothetical protein
MLKNKSSLKLEKGERIVSVNFFFILRPVGETISWTDEEGKDVEIERKHERIITRLQFAVYIPPENVGMKT